MKRSLPIFISVSLAVHFNLSVSLSHRKHGLVYCLFLLLVLFVPVPTSATRLLYPRLLYVYTAYTEGIIGK